MLDDLLNMFGAMGKDLGTYESRKVGRDEVSGLTVSTAYTSDQGYETAILDAAGTHPVERYSNKEAAILGHAKWVETAPSLTAIHELGYGSLTSPTTITLVRKEERNVNSVVSGA